MKNLDEIDLKIIELLRANGRTSLKDLSGEVFLTTPAVAARIEKLEKEGIEVEICLLYTSDAADEL